MGQTQHTVGTANVRASCIALLLTGNVGAPGTGANIFRGHTNVQGATDLGLDISNLPLYYGLTKAPGSTGPACGTWNTIGCRASSTRCPRRPAARPRTRKENMETPGITSTRWFDAVNLPEDQIDQRSLIRGMVVFGHGGNTVTRVPEAAKGLEKLDLLVVADPHPTSYAQMSERKNNTYLLPICTNFETDGSRTASNRSLQWGEQVVKPIFESRDDYDVLYRLANKLGFADRMFKNIKVVNGRPEPEDVLREINRGGWSTGYTASRRSG
jgi:formate dehydrogenase major subunit